MFPSFAPTGSSSRWHCNKPSQQEVIEELTYLEEKLKDKNEKVLQIGVSVLIRGKPVLPTKVSIDKSDDQDDDEGLLQQQQQQQQQQPFDAMPDSPVRYLDSDDIYPNDEVQSFTNDTNTGNDPDDYDYWGINP